MPWLKLLHALALVGWCASLLYLPAMILANISRNGAQIQAGLPPLRMFFIAAATPLALLAIITGTALFLRGNIVENWLILKLSAVAAMVLCHALYGAIIVRVETDPGTRARLPCLAIAAITAGLILSVLGLVLSQPVLRGF